MLLYITFFFLFTRNESDSIESSDTGLRVGLKPNCAIQRSLYYIKQAELLFQMALASSDPRRATQLRDNAILLLNLSQMSNEPRTGSRPLGDQFNAAQMKPSRPA